MKYAPTNPYLTEVERDVWDKGLTAVTMNPTATRNDLNPFTSGDTCTAWAHGFDDGLYKPAPFDPTTIVDLDRNTQEYISVNVKHDRDSGNYAIVKGTYLVYDWVGGTIATDDKPAWTQNRWKERAVRVNVRDFTRIARGAINDPIIVAQGSVELPCPPYEYTYVDGGMRITAGAYTKHGMRDEWEGVLAEMQKKLEEMPAGIDVSDVSINIDVIQPATARWSTRISVDMLLGGDEQLDGDIWTGSMDDLEIALDDAISTLSTDDLNSGYEEIEYEMDDYADPDVEVPDMMYDLSDAVE